ncbi:MAG: PQQ-dependent sugar dehydrogenase [Acidimicrobiales bacterium]
MRRLAALLAVALLLAGCGRTGGPGPVGGPAPASVDQATGSTFIPGSTDPALTPASDPASTAVAPAPLPPTADTPPALTLTRLVGLTSPTAMAVRAGDAALYATEQAGRVQAVADGRASVVADISDRVLAEGERGLLGLAFSADGATLYLYWTARQPTGRVTIAAYQFRGGRADVGAERVLITIPHDRYGNHNGGQLALGPDGFLYAGVGDGGGSGNPLKTARDTRALLGKVLRIDPTKSGAGRPYAIPPGNPFADGAAGAPEVWAYGLRNPWRFSWDRSTGQLFIADVGQDAYEEVNAVAGDRPGVDYGWNRREGLHAYEGGSRPAGAVDPVIELPHEAGVCSVTGGYVYRGARIPGLVGRYVFTDYCDSKLRAARPAGGGWLVEALGAEGQQVTTFGQDEAGELYILDDTGLSRLDPA